MPANSSTRLSGTLALLLPVVLWAASMMALLQALKANNAASLLAHAHGARLVEARVQHLRGLAVMWVVALAGLQIASGVVGAMVLRSRYRMRAAVSFAMGAGAVIVLNVAWLLGLLVWLRMYGDTR